MNEELLRLQREAADWQARAEKAEATIAQARTALHPTIQLSNASYQEGYRYAAARVLAILGEP